MTEEGQIELKHAAWHLYHDLFEYFNNSATSYNILPVIERAFESYQPSAQLKGESRNWKISNHKKTKYVR